MAKEIEKIEKYQCFICKKNFRRKLSNLRRHLREIHDPILRKNQQVKCKICDKLYKNFKKIIKIRLSFN